MIRFFLCLSLTTALGALTLEEAAKRAPLPSLAQHGGVLLADLNEDGHEDCLISNLKGYGVYLFNPFERKNLEWGRGWTQVLREGSPGDANSLPLLDEASYQNGVLSSADGKKQLTREELLRVPGPAPLTPAESLQSMRLKPGFEIQLVAHEPLVQDPVFMDWDERGRMWVVEMGDYPFAAGEKTTDGKTGQGNVSALQTGRIKILEDSNADGVYDKATLFLDGLRHPTGLAMWKGGVFIASIPDIFYAKDTDGDGRCDLRETWFTGFTAGNPQHLVNGFCWGLDGWLYGANGDSGGDLTEVKTGRRFKLGTQDFRFHPSTGVFELEPGRSQYGRWRDDYGNWFGNNNSTLAWHYHVPIRYVEAHPELVVTSLRATLNEDKALYPISLPQRRYNWASATNTLTSGCSPMPWRDGHDETLLVCEPANNLVHRELLDHTRFPITSQRHPEDVKSEFLASSDPWFRPSLARPGPDGAIYIADMYRLVLEHPEWIPADIARGLDLRAGEKLGRIYRVARTETKAKPVLTGMTSPHRWQRDTAQRLHLEKADPAAVPELQKIVRAEEQPLATRLQAAWTAHLLAKDGQDDLISLLKASYPKTRGAALVAAGSMDITAEELATWFPKAVAKKTAAHLPAITHVSPDRQKVVQSYLTQLATLRGDAKRGEAIFEQTCAACHKLGALGVEVGPDLATIASKPAEQIIEAIFDPNRAVEQRHAVTQLTLKDGTSLSGLISTETSGTLVLRLPGGADLPVKRSLIKDQKNLTTSMMPEGLESVLAPQAVADLLARIQGR